MENLIDGWLDADGIRFPDGFAYEGRQGREKGTYGIVRLNVETNDGLFAIPPGLGTVSWAPILDVPSRVAGVVARLLGTA